MVGQHPVKMFWVGSIPATSAIFRHNSEVECSPVKRNVPVAESGVGAIFLLSSLAEHLAVNQSVPGSIPGEGA